MKIRTTACALLLVAFACTIPRMSQGFRAEDPEAALAAIQTWYQEELRKAREANMRIDFAALQRTQLEKAKAALEGVDVSKAEPAKGLALAQLFQMARMNTEMVAAAERYLTSNPEPAPKYQAHQILLTGHMAANNVESLEKVLAEVKPPSATAAASHASMVARSYAPAVARKRGVKAGLDLIQAAEDQVPFDKMTEAREKQLAEGTVVSIALGRASLLEGAGQKAEALAALENGKKRLPEGSPALRQLDSKLRLAKLPGSPAPALKQDRGYGGFTSLESMKGKVVVLDFTAHW